MAKGYRWRSSGCRDRLNSPLSLDCANGSMAMLRVLTTTEADFRSQFQRLLSRGDEAESSVESQVRAILMRVQRDGDDAVCDFTAQYDGLALTTDTIRVSSSEMATAYDQCSPETLAALQGAAENIR